MPRSSTHLAVELAFLPVFILVGYLLRLKTALLPFSVGYLGGSLLLSPDLDLRGSRAARRWGCLRVIWWPYALLFRHRGLSHHPLFGPLTRFLYLGAWLAGLGVLLVRLGLQFPPTLWAWLIPALVGLWVPQLLHILLDRL
ncbi:MAG: DUF2227 family putative metal-binding protein [Candidatus Bipolaricaulota bacterium]|nr:DUF2227 family putative metal-binding protein [Candidatus Bipolaricaulota bacterium]MDW8126956.1 DUF2227 family putative metal-binding protein [Candidatus Bipolaricaulota bacterium]